MPIFSANLPEKDRLVRHFKKENWLHIYASHLKNVMKDANVVALSAVGSSAPISKSSISKRPWLRWQADLIGLSLENAKSLDLTKKGEKVTSKFIYSANGKTISGFVLMMGGNHLPQSHYLADIANIFRNIGCE